MRLSVRVGLRAVHDPLACECSSAAAATRHPQVSRSRRERNADLVLHSPRRGGFGAPAAATARSYRQPVASQCAILRRASPAALAPRRPPRSGLRRATENLALAWQFVRSARDGFSALGSRRIPRAPSHSAGFSRARDQCSRRVVLPSGQAPSCGVRLMLALHFSILHYFIHATHTKRRPPAARGW